MIVAWLLAGALAATPEAPLAAHADAQSWRFAALPLANFSSDAGAGGGVRGAAYLRAPERALYRMAMEAQLFATTGGQRSALAGVDLPELGAHQLRLIARTGYGRNSAAPYYGLDADGGAREATAFHQFEERSFWTHLALRVPLTEGLSLFGVHRLSATRALSAAGSLLDLERPFGWEGVRFSELSFGALYDTRDHEAQPTRGLFAELSLRGSSALLASESETLGLFGSVAGFLSPHERVVLAGRASADRVWGRVPMTRRRDFGGWMQSAGVGGGASLRGALQEESVGPLKALLNGEVRLRLLEVEPFEVKTKLGLVLFADVGRAWEGLSALFGSPLAVRAGYGGGVRVVLQEYFVVRVDAARAADRTRLYIQFGELF